jgi:hypothetical protein
MSKQSRFIHHMTKLVLKEQEIDEKKNNAMLQGTLEELAKRGVAIYDLVVSGKLKHCALQTKT